MSKLKKLYLNLWGKIEDVIKRFPITMIIVAVVTIIGAIIIDNNPPDWIGDVIIIGSIWSVGTLFSETLFKKNKIIRYLAVLIALGIAIVFNQFEDIFPNCKEEVLIRFLCTYLVTIGCIIIYTFAKQSNLDIKKYLLNVVSENFILGITYAILNAGVAAVAGIFIALILSSSSDYVFILRLLVLIFGFFYFPSVISIFANGEKVKENSFVEKLIIFVLFPLAIIAIIIIYIYIAKILILRQMPKNMVGRILIGVYLAVFPIWAMVVSINKEKINKIASKIPYMYMPLIILEIYSIFARIEQYGITPIRYLGLIFAIFQILSFITIIYKKEKYLRELLLLIPILTIVFLVSPANYKNVSIFSQKRILKKYIDNSANYDNYSDEEKRRFYGAYDYLMDTDRKYVEQNLSQEQRDTLENDYYNNNYSYNNRYSDYKYAYFNNDSGYIDVSNFNKIYDASFDNYENVDVKNILLEYNKQKINIDLSDIIEKAILINDNQDSSMQNFLEKLEPIKVDENHYLYLNRLVFEYDFYKRTEDIQYLTLHGYILEK